MSPGRTTVEYVGYPFSDTSLEKKLSAQFPFTP
jgi:hypothetical protein